jgi:hypothetical protein
MADDKNDQVANMHLGGTDQAAYGIPYANAPTGELDTEVQLRMPFNNAMKMICPGADGQMHPAQPKAKHKMRRAYIAKVYYDNYVRNAPAGSYLEDPADMDTQLPEKNSPDCKFKMTLSEGGGD